MSDEDWMIISKMMKSHPSYNMEKMESDIEIGIKNGHSLQTQLTIISKVLRELKANDSDFKV